MKIWTNFYSFFNTTYNLLAESRARGFRKLSPTGVGVMAVDFFLLVPLPATLGFVLRQLVKGNDDDDETYYRELAGENMGYLLGTMVGLREFQPLVTPFNYEGPAGTRLFAEAKDISIQVKQGEADESFWRSINRAFGILFHYPAGQVDRTVRGVMALTNGDSKNPGVILTGPPFRRR